MDKDKFHIAEFLVMLVAAYVFTGMVSATESSVASLISNDASLSATTSTHGDIGTSSTTGESTYSETYTAALTTQIMYISPQNPTVRVGESLQFKAYLSGTEQRDIEWKVLEGSIGGYIYNGLYTAPLVAGKYRLYARNILNNSYGSTTITVVPKEATRYATTTTTTSTVTTAPATTTAPTTTSSTYTIYSSTTPANTPVRTTTYIEPRPTYTASATTTVNISAEKEDDLLYKDSNLDGISDYDSKYIYNIDPQKPSPTSVYEGRRINALEKILLGFDPKERELKKIDYEDPRVSTTSVTGSYRVESIILNADKKVLISGKALPNSFVTLYIYSTPIIVTVKADEAGEWQYVLDKELEDGKHQIYVAAVNNTGKIVARSKEYSFTKTAEAATLDSLPQAGFPSVVQEPSLFSYVDVYVVAIAFLTLFGAAVAFIGMKKISHTEGDSKT